MGVTFGADDASAWGLMGYIGGITAKVKTQAYINSVLQYTHARLATFFDEWFDALAKSDPTSYQHMYEWPEIYQDYSETVGKPHERLWKHTFSGGGADGKASFEFLPSRTSTPVNPILLEEGPTGKAVKSGVHIFVWKAQAFEYGAQITVEPYLAKMLAFAGDGSQSREGSSAGREGINFSAGPMTFKAGGGKMMMKFTTAYVSWWQAMATNEFNSRILPTLEQDLINVSALNKAIKIGKNTSNKNMSITAQASTDHAVFEEAMAQGIADLGAVQVQYIRRAAAQRRMDLYGE